MDNDMQVTWKVSEAPPTRKQREGTAYERWGKVFTDIAASAEGQWVQLDGEFTQSEAQSVYEAGKRHTEDGKLGKIVVNMSTSRVLDERYGNGVKKRMFHVFIQVQKPDHNSGNEMVNVF